MAKNSNINLPRFVQGDIESANLAKPIRNRKTQRTIYIWETNRTTADVENSVGILVLQCKLTAQVFLQPTTPIGGDFLKPKFENLSATSIYTQTPKGYILENFSVQTTNYRFATFTKPTTEQEFVNTYKYRITNLEPIIDNKNRFLYFDFSSVQETSSSLKNIDKISFQPVADFVAARKTKYIFIELDESAILLANSLSVQTSSTANGPRSSVTYNIQNLPTKTLQLLKFRNSNPLTYDNISWYDATGNGIRKEEINDWIFSWLGTFKNITNETVLYKNEFGTFGNFTNTSGFLFAESLSAYEPNWFNVLKSPKTFFDYYHDMNSFFDNNRQNINYTERTLTANEITRFLNGTLTIQNFSIPSKIPLNYVNNQQKLSDLNSSSDDDRGYYALTNLTDFANLINYDVRTVSTWNTPQGPMIQKKGTWYYAPKNGFKRSVINYDDQKRMQQGRGKLILQVSLDQDGYNPTITVAPFFTDNIKIITYDINMSKLTENNFAANFIYSAANPTTVINL